MSHRKEQGNILGYVLVGVVLAALVIGGIFVVRRYLPTSSSTETTSSTEDSNVSDSGDAPSVSEAESTDTNQNSEELKMALAQQAAEEKKAQELKAAEEKKAQEQKAANEASSRAAANTATNASNLPATGPEDTVISVAGVTLVTALAVAYIRSRTLI